MKQALANSAAFWVLLVLVLCALYLLPTMIGAARRVDRLALIFLVNLIGGTTGVGWLAALILAFGPRRLSPGPPPVSWPPDVPPVSWPPQGLAEVRDVIVMRVPRQGNLITLAAVKPVAGTPDTSAIGQLWIPGRTRSGVPAFRLGGRGGLGP